MNSRIVARLTLLVVLAAVFYIYSFGFSGAMYYDDFGPFSGLSTVTNWDSAINYVLTNESGPLGRPISMLSFLLNMHDWAGDQSHFFMINALIHTFNGLLVAIITWQLAVLTGQRHATWLAVGVAALWVCLPIQVTSSLIAVQRMTSLAALFSLSGLALYLGGLRIQRHKPARGLLLQLVGIGPFTLLAVLAKESGALMPVLVLVLEVTLLASVEVAKPWRRWRMLIGALTLLALLAYMLRMILLDHTVLDVRGFTVEQRFISESLILLDYLRLAFIPDIYSFHPFHDNYRALPGWTPLGVLAMSLWTALLLGAILLRRRLPIVAFAILWFLAAHLLESTFVALELYFEHRNYIALFGPCLAVVWLIARVPMKFRRLAVGAFGLYFLLMLGALFQVTSLWGQQRDAAVVWFDSAKGSSRASEHLALLLLGNRQTYEAWRVLEIQSERCPDCVGSQVQAMLLSCVMGDEAKTRAYYDHSLQLAQSARLLGSAPSTLAATLKQIDSKACKFVSLDDLRVLNQALLKYQVSGLGLRQRAALLVNLQSIAIDQNEPQRALEYLQQLWQDKPDPALGEGMVRLWLKLGQIDEARAFAASEMCRRLPRNPLIAEQQMQRCQATRANIEKISKEDVGS